MYVYAGHLHVLHEFKDKVNKQQIRITDTLMYNRCLFRALKYAKSE